MSGRPSPSKSPTATPEPSCRTLFAAPVRSSRRLVKVMPVCSGRSDVKPVFPFGRTVNSRHLQPGAIFQPISLPCIAAPGPKRRRKRKESRTGQSLCEDILITTSQPNEHQPDDDQGNQPPLLFLFQKRQELSEKLPHTLIELIARFSQWQRQRRLFF